MATTYLQELAASHSQQKTNKFRTSVTDAWTVALAGARSNHTVLAAVLVDNMANERTAHAISESVALRIRVALEDASPSSAALSPADRAERALKAANYDLFYRAANENKRETLGASVMVALLEKKGEQVTLQLLHVGNGRAYLVRGAELRPLTTEQTARQAQREFAPHATDKDDNPQWDRPFRYLGAEAEVTIVRTAPLAIEREDRIILASAQVRPTVVKQAATTVRRRNSHAAVNALVKQAAAYRPDAALPPPITDSAAVVMARHQVNPLFRRRIVILLCSLALLLAAWYFLPLIQLFPKEPTPTPTQSPKEEATQASEQSSAGGETSEPITSTQQLTSTEDTELIPSALPVTTTLTVTARTPVTPSVTGQVAISTTNLTPNGTVTPTVSVQLTTSTTITSLETITKTLTPQPADQPSPVVLATLYPVTPTPTPSPTPIATATGTATPTPAPVLIEETATLTPTPAGEQALPLVATPTTTALSTPENTETAIALAPLAPLPDGFVIKLGAPEADFTAIGRTEFTWSASADLSDGYEFELIFWRRGEDPILHGRGYGGRGRNSSAVVNFAKLGLGGEDTGEYFWGVRLLRVGSKQPLGVYWGGRRIVIHFQPEPTPKPEPCNVECGQSSR